MTQVEMSNLENLKYQYEFTFKSRKSLSGVVQLRPDNKNGLKGFMLCKESRQNIELDLKDIISFKPIATLKGELL
jgi:hypothetical protein